ncbi:hypothetical protein EAE96_005825 [Botrytis aclada]|nr:hypothetical protein EAE96_005825 [Botrytis aclada]
MRKSSPGFRGQIRAPMGEPHRDKPKLEYVEKPKFTSAWDLGSILEHPKPDRNRYTVAKVPEAFERMESEVSGENKADDHSSANEHPASRRKIPLRKRSFKEKEISTLAPPKNHNNHKIRRKPLPEESVIKSKFIDPSQGDYDKAPSKAAPPSQSGSKHEISNIKGKNPSHHGAHSGMGNDSNNNRPLNGRRTHAEGERKNPPRGQNDDIITPKIKRNSALHKKDGYFNSQQYSQLLKERAAAHGDRHPIATDGPNSRQVPDSVLKSHTNQGSSSQLPVNYSNPSRRLSRRNNESC